MGFRVSGADMLSVDEGGEREDVEGASYQYQKHAAAPTQEGYRVKGARARSNRILLLRSIV